MAAAWLSAHRLGWRWDQAFEMTDDLGVQVSLIRNSPAAILARLRNAACRQLERAVGAVWARTRPEFAGKRVAVEHVRALLTTGRSMTPQHRGAARAMMCNAIWTNSRAVEAGYNVLDECPLCGAVGDTPFHRVWRCPCSEAQRSKVAPAWLVAEAARADPRDPFWVTGLFVHPAHDWPSPAQQQPATIKKLVDEAQFEDDMYIDGSCTASPFIELRRAGASVVACDTLGRERARAIMPIPRELHQTPQAAEYGAFALVLHLMAGQAQVYGDCMSVVRDSERKAVAVLRRAGVNAGIVRAALTDLPNWRLMGAIKKVKAHQNAATMPEGREKILAIGNGLADEAAKQAAAMHPQPAPAQESLLQARLARAPLILKTVAHTMEIFPRLQAAALGNAAARLRAGAPGSKPTKAPPKKLHDWAFAAQRWRCARCLAMSSKRWLPRALREQACRGYNESMNVRHIAGRGHRIIAAGGSPPLIICAACGSWSVRRTRGLAGQCPGAPTASGKAALARIAAGEAPWLTVELGTRVALAPPTHAWDSDLDMWVPRGGLADEENLQDDTALDAQSNVTHATSQTAAHAPCGSDSAADPFETRAKLDAEPYSRDTDMDAHATFDLADDDDPFGHGGQLDQPGDSGQRFNQALGPADVGEARAGDRRADRRRLPEGCAEELADTKRPRPSPSAIGAQEGEATVRDGASPSGHSEEDKCRDGHGGDKHEHQAPHEVCGHDHLRLDGAHVHRGPHDRHGEHHRSCDAPQIASGSQDGPPGDALRQEDPPVQQGPKRPRLRLRGPTDGRGVKRDGRKDHSSTGAHEHGSNIDLCASHGSGIGEMRDAGVGEPSNDRRPAVRRRLGDAPGAATATGKVSAASDTLVEPCAPVWMRDPAWLYLPHLQRESPRCMHGRASGEHGADTEADGNAESEEQGAQATNPDVPRRGNRGSPPGAGADHARRQSRSPTASRRRTDSGDGGREAARAAHQTHPADPRADHQQTCHVMEPARTSFVVGLRHVHASSGGGSAAAAAVIQGRGKSPGPATTAAAAPQCGGARVIPQHLARSFDDIEERRIRRKQLRGDEAPPPSAADRLAALRRRLELRWAAAATAAMPLDDTAAQQADRRHRALGDPAASPPG